MSTAPQIKTALLENLKELHRPTMRSCFEQSAQRAEKETLSYEQYLLELAERECDSRRHNRIAKLQRESGLPREKTLANFDLKRLPTKVRIDSRLLLPARSRCLMKMLPVWYGNNGRQEEATEHGQQARTDCSGSDALSEEHTEAEEEHS